MNGMAINYFNIFDSPPGAKLACQILKVKYIPSFTKADLMI